MSREIEELQVLPVFVLDHGPLLIGDDLALRVGTVLAVITNVDRKIASSDTIIVNSPYG